MRPATIGLLVHSQRKDKLEKAVEVIKYLHANGITVYGEKWLADALEVPLLSTPVDMMIALGGDGTLLRAARYAIKWDIPLMGINLGRVGFLTEVEPDALEESMVLLAQGAFYLEERMLLSVSVNGQERICAVNDAVVSRSASVRLITINASVSGDIIGQYRADGLIVASPTGSTGYSLSAGGPIINPNVSCFILSPICAHSLQHRPVVVSSDETIRLSVTFEETHGPALTIDGMDPIMLHDGDEIDILKDDHTLKLVRFKQPCFFSLVRNKLSEWTR